MILLDGVDSIVGIVLSALLLWASALSERKGTTGSPTAWRRRRRW
jgi:hypothetical protein